MRGVTKVLLLFGVYYYSTVLDSDSYESIQESRRKGWAVDVDWIGILFFGPSLVRYSFLITCLDWIWLDLGKILIINNLSLRYSEIRG